MQLCSEKFVKIVEALVLKLNAENLNHLDISMVLTDALNAQDVKVTDDVDGVAITVNLDDDTFENLMVVIQKCNACEDEPEPMGSHGKLDASSLLAMLAQDVAMINSRPGSKGGANMRRVFDEHGYGC